MRAVMAEMLCVGCGRVKFLEHTTDLHPRGRVWMSYTSHRGRMCDVLANEKDPCVCEGWTPVKAGTVFVGRRRNPSGGALMLINVANGMMHFLDIPEEVKKFTRECEKVLARKVLAALDGSR